MQYECWIDNALGGAKSLSGSRLFLDHAFSPSAIRNHGLDARSRYKLNEVRRDGGVAELHFASVSIVVRCFVLIVCAFASSIELIAVASVASGRKSPNLKCDFPGRSETVPAYIHSPRSGVISCRFSDCSLTSPKAK